MRIIPVVLTALALAGCPEMSKQVPDEALADVPPDRIEALAAIERRIDHVEDGIALQEQSVQRAQDRLELEETRFDALEDRMRSETRLKQAAVEKGDRMAAEAADETRDELRSRLDVSRGDLEEAQSVLEVEKADLSVLEAEHAFRKSELELARAIAVSGEREIDIDSFRVDAEQKQLAWEQAQRARENLGGEGMKEDDMPMAP